MNDVMKKRLIGVAILVIIGVLTPLLLSRCMHGGDEGDDSRSSMRVYDVKPDGQAQSADANASGHDGAADGAQSADEAQADEAQSADENTQRPATPDTVSPQSQSEFSTPPVHGDSGNSSAQGEASSEPSDAHSQPRKPATDNTPSKPEPSGHQSESGSHDYGASSSGSQSSNNERSSGSNASNSGSDSSAGGEKSSISGWVVQIASFSEQGNARDMVNKLKKQFDASYTPGKVNGKTLYRVNVGPFDSKQAAQDAADKLSQAGHKGLVRHLP